MRRLIPLVALLTAAGLAACGGSNSSPRTAAAPTSSTVTKTVTAPRTTSTAHTPQAGAHPSCRAANLSLSYLGQQGAAGHGEIGFALKNTGSRTCHTIGYPGILFLDQAGHPLPTAPKHVTSDMAGSVPVVSLDVAPGSQVSFRLFVTHGAVPGLPCTTAYGLQAIPPNDTATLRVTIPDGGAFECKDATVSPLRPGASAFS
jgi:hypothetical protein